MKDSCICQRSQVKANQLQGQEKGLIVPKAKKAANETEARNKLKGFKSI